MSSLSLQCFEQLGPEMQPEVDGTATVLTIFSFICFTVKILINWDTLNYYRDCPTNGIVGFYSAILRSKDADRLTNRVDTDQTAP